MEQGAGGVSGRKLEARRWEMGAWKSAVRSPLKQWSLSTDYADFRNPNSLLICGDRGCRKSADPYFEVGNTSRPKKSKEVGVI